MPSAPAFRQLSIWLLVLCAYALFSNWLLTHHNPNKTWDVQAEILKASKSSRKAANNKAAYTIATPIHIQAKPKQENAEHKNILKSSQQAISSKKEAGPVSKIASNNNAINDDVYTLGVSNSTSNNNKVILPTPTKEGKRLPTQSNNKLENDPNPRKNNSSEQANGEKEDVPNITQHLAPKTYTCSFGNETLKVPINTPTFVLAGVQKSGTTSLLTYFRDHPWMLQTKRRFRREAHFFDANYGGLLKEAQKLQYSEKEKSCFYLSHYMQLFPIEEMLQNTTNHLYTFEKTPSYFSSRDVPSRIKQTCPWSKVVLILRNPVDRTYSQFKMTVRNNHAFREVSLEDFAAHEIGQMRAWNISTAPLINESATVPFLHTLPESSWMHRLETKQHAWDTHMLIRKSLYSIQLEWWLDNFTVGKDLLVLNYADLDANTEAVYHRILEFANIPPDPIQNHNFSRTRRDKRVGHLPMSNATREYLQQFFAPYNARLEAMLGPEWSDDKLGWSKKVD
jgi:hypothetical protein